LVGESGCGKSVTALSLTRLPPTDQAQLDGCVVFDGQDLLAATQGALRRVRGRGIAYVFQDPASTLNPVLRIEEQLREALPPDLRAAERRDELLGLLRTVQLPAPERILRAYPHELSGGMQQRVVVAMAAAARPKLLVADEPTTALDVTTQQHVLSLLDTLRRTRGMGLLLITHNLGLVARYADRVGVMYAGQVVESGPAVAVLSAPRHPYTVGLLAAVPRLDMRSINDLHGIPGRVPHPADWPTGCAFAPRCPHATDACRAAPVPVTTTPDARSVRCIHPRG
jgi:oligopeptide/dipeptide ABC transporter ATP-binding protein